MGPVLDAYRSGSTSLRGAMVIISETLKLRLSASIGDTPYPQCASSPEGDLEVGVSCPEGYSDGWSTGVVDGRTRCTSHGEWSATYVAKEPRSARSKWARSDAATTRSTSDRLVHATTEIPGCPSSRTPST